MANQNSDDDDDGLNAQYRPSLPNRSTTLSYRRKSQDSSTLLAESHLTSSYSACSSSQHEPDETEGLLSRILKPELPPGNLLSLILRQDVAKDAMLEGQLIALSFTTGIQDACTFTTFNVFTSKQTGNTLFMALYAFRHPVLGPQIERNVAVSLASFLLGSAFFGHLGRRIRSRRRAWLLATTFFQTILMFAAATLRFWGPRVHIGHPAMVIIAMLSFASSGQIAMAAGVGMAELNTTMITGSLVQISNDRDIFKLHNRARNRRILFYLSLMAGCFVGAASVLKEASLGLLIGAAVKGVVTISFLFNRGVIAVIEDRTEGIPVATTHEELTMPVSEILWGE